MAAVLVLAACEARSEPAVACSPAGGERVVVRAVGDDFSLALDDGRTLRLAGIEAVRDTAASPHLAEDARRRLSDWLAGNPATMRPLGATPDRWGRVPALVFAAAPAGGEAAEPVAVGLALVDAGLARGAAAEGLHACWPATLAAEAGARAAGLGLWSDPYYAVRNAADVPALADAMGDTAVVQGRVVNVGATRSRLYIDLGPVHRSVALRLARRDLFILDQLGVRQDGLVGRVIRARGFMDDRNGPHIDVVDPDQIEIVDEASAPAPAP